MGLFACSGPGAPAVIAESIAIGYTHAQLLGGMIAVSLLLAIPPRHWLIPSALLFLLAVHPAWTVSAIEGDCGFLKREASYLFTGLGVAAMCWQIGRVIWSHCFRPDDAIGTDDEDLGSDRAGDLERLPPYPS